MAYNKSKHVEAAQKLLNQGKVPQAIAEYQHILKYEPRDQVTLMTVGELYIRQGETFQAIDYFERLAQIFVGDGFLTKAIAVYKRIAKLAPEEIKPLEKLADLYVQQGVMSEARPLFLQLAEIHLKANRQPEAISLLKKLLIAEPDNLRIQVRLADLYQAMGQTRDAIQTYVAAAQRAMARGDHGECDKLADKALKLEANNVDALIVKARSLSSQGKHADAAKLLEQVPGLEKGGEQTELLLDLYLKNSQRDEATALAMRVFDADEKTFGPAQKVTGALLEGDHGEEAMAILSRIRMPMVDAGEHETVGRLLNDLAARLPENLEPREWLVETYGRTSDSFHLTDALAQLVDVLLAHKKYDRAKEVAEQLVEKDPDNESSKRKLNKVLRAMGVLTEEEAPAVPEETLQTNLHKAPEPKVDRHEPSDSPEVAAIPAPTEAPLDDETQKFIAQSLTDVDLFASYGLTQKAIGLLEAILRRAPLHTPSLEKLLDFVLGAGDDRRTAELASQLEKIHTQRGDERGAERFGELRRRFQRAAGLSDDELAAAAGAQVPGLGAPVAAEIPPPDVHATIPEVAESTPVTVNASAEAPASEHQDVHEVDLSEEWASLLDKSDKAESVEEVPAVSSLDAPAEFEISAEPVNQQETAVPEPSVTDLRVELPIADSASQQREHRPAEIIAKAPKDIAKEPPAPPKVAEPEFEVEQDYELVLDPEALVPAHEQKPPETPAAPPVPPDQRQPVAKKPSPAAPAGAFASDQFLADLASEMEELGLGELTPSSSGAQPPAKAPAPPKAANLADGKGTAPGGAGALQEIFDDFRADLGEMGAEEEDLETHYNLGTAFREMGLLDEAISEFQKVAKAHERGRPFPYAMQNCTLLGLAFMEKGQPAIAAIWYERALQTPGVEPESILALRYDLGLAQESAGEPEAALKSFSKVYAMNIDYRDVAERIAALQKPAR